MEVSPDSAMRVCEWRLCAADGAAGASVATLTHGARPCARSGLLLRRVTKV